MAAARIAVAVRSRHDRRLCHLARGYPSRVVRIGHGRISECLRYHQEDPEVSAYSGFGTLRVTWAAVPPDQMEGVERYLVEHWKPLVVDRTLKVLPIVVNSPFAG